jgi:Inosine-uridine nucleoside N-ribohydrolase
MKEQEQPMHENPARPLYFDCDTGVDDSLALAYLLSSPEIELVGIGTVSGNVSAEQGAKNTLELLTLANRDAIPVAVGAHDHLVQPFDGGVPHIHGSNGIGDVELPPAEATAVDCSAAELLVSLAHAHPGRLSIVAVGPLTNLALALEREPDLSALVKDVTIMGGAALAPGNVSAVAEANIGNDPEAAARVFEASWPITLVPLDITMKNTFEEEHRAALLAAADPLANALGRILDLYFDFYTGTYGRRSSALHDPLAAAIAVGAIATTNAPRVSVEVDSTHGPGRGQTICDLRDQWLGPFDQPGATCRVVLATDRQLAPHLVERILSRTSTAATKRLA